MVTRNFPIANLNWTLPQWREYHRLDTGVLGSPGGTDRQVFVDGSGPYFKRLPGARYIQGVYVYDDMTWQGTADPNTSGQPRIDRVVDQLNADGTIETVIVTGNPSTSPTPPDLTQTLDGMWQEHLAYGTVRSGFASLLPGDAQVVDERRFMPARVYPVASEALRPSSPRFGDEAIYPSGRRDRWTGSGWQKEGPSLTDWAMGVTSGTYGWPVTSQYGKWSRSGDVIDAFGVASLNANPPGGATGQLIFTLPPLGASVPEGTVIGTADLGPAGGGVSHHGYVRVESGIGRVYSFTSPITVAPANGWTLTVRLCYTAALA